MSDKEQQKVEGSPKSASASTESAPSNGAASERAGTGFLAVMQSVGAAMIGVQSKKNKERDFTHGKPLHFIIGGLIGTFIFLVCVWGAVQYLIATT